MNMGNVLYLFLRNSAQDWEVGFLVWYFMPNGLPMSSMPPSPDSGWEPLRLNYSCFLVSASMGPFKAQRRARYRVVGECSCSRKGSARTMTVELIRLDKNCEEQSTESECQ